MEGRILTEIGLEEIRELRRPFTPEAIKFKIQAEPKPKSGGAGHTQAMLVSYIDARLVVERLNHVLGFTWADSYESVPGGLKCTINLGEVARSDVGWSRGTDTDTDLKALYSDAFKRAAVKFGVGVSLYGLPRLYRQADDLVHRGQKWFLPDRLLPGLRETYRQWLASEGVKAYGEPLDHGDSPDSQGDVEADANEPAVETGDALLVARQKALFMASALASKSGTDPTDMRNLVQTAADHGELVILYRRFAADLQKVGGDPRMVAQRFAQAHPEAA